MSKPFEQNEFAKALSQKCPNPKPCPFCGSTDFKVYEKFTMLQVQTGGEGIKFGQAIPSGIVICGNCGHIDLFALASLDFEP